MACSPRAEGDRQQSSYDRLLESLRYRTSRFVKRSALRDGTPESMWIRKVMNSALRSCLNDFDPRNAHAIQAGGDHWSCMQWASFDSIEFNADGFDATSNCIDMGAVDVAICDQILNRIADPVGALMGLSRLVRPGGSVVVSTPFLVKIDPLPGDLWRFTQEGLAVIMERAGLVNVHVDSWGNRRCIKANLRRWIPHRIWRSLRNEPLFPAVVWGWGTVPQSELR